MGLGEEDLMDTPDTPCSICLEAVSDEGDRSITKLQCSHEFHLDCIGSTFNAKGAMQCPNCRKIEKGKWLFANGNRSDTESSMDDWMQDEDLHETSDSEMEETNTHTAELPENTLDSTARDDIDPQDIGVERHGCLRGPELAFSLSSPISSRGPEVASSLFSSISGREGSSEELRLHMQVADLVAVQETKETEARAMSVTGSEADVALPGTAVPSSREEFRRSSEESFNVGSGNRRVGMLMSRLRFYLSQWLEEEPHEFLEDASHIRDWLKRLAAEGVNIDTVNQYVERLLDISRGYELVATRPAAEQAKVEVELALKALEDEHQALLSRQQSLIGECNARVVLELDEESLRHEIRALQLKLQETSTALLADDAEGRGMEMNSITQRLNTLTADRASLEGQLVDEAKCEARKAAALRGLEEETNAHTAELPENTPDSTARDDIDPQDIGVERHGCLRGPEVAFSLFSSISSRGPEVASSLFSPISSREGSSEEVLWLHIKAADLEARLQENDNRLKATEDDIRKIKAKQQEMEAQIEQLRLQFVNDRRDSVTFPLRIPTDSAQGLNQ